MVLSNNQSFINFNNISNQSAEVIVEIGSDNGFRGKDV
jgi:hypothetical protein